MTETRTLVLIPARMAATRLPGKPLLDIAGLPMIVHVLRRAEAAGIGRVAVATDTPEIAAAVTAHGGEAVMTRADHPSGSDRIYEALRQARSRRARPRSSSICRAIFRPSRPDNIRDVLAPLADPAVDIATLAAEIHTEEESDQPERGEGGRLADRRDGGCARCISPAPPRPTATGRATTISASTPIAARRWSASSRCRPRRWSSSEKLEQLRALEAGMRIDVTIVDTVPRGVDTPADLETARQHTGENLSG